MADIAKVNGIHHLETMKVQNSSFLEIGLIHKKKWWANEPYDIAIPIDT